MAARLLFVHGAGGFVEDRRMADDLAEALDVGLDMPRFPDDDMSFDAWAAPVRSSLSTVRADDFVVAHSFGASILLRVLAEKQWAAPARAVLLAMPNWCPQGWDVEEYAFDGREPDVALSLHHCRDDEVVPFTHLALNSTGLPSARPREHAGGGHQFDGLIEQIAADARGAGDQRKRQGL